MATARLFSVPDRTEPPVADLMLQEAIHRSANDLQLIVSLLAFESRRAKNSETRRVLTEATARVSVLARARTALLQQRQQTLGEALHQLCNALHSQAEPRSIIISLDVASDPIGLSDDQITTLAMVTNELVTNAIKHAFPADRGGRICVSLRQHDKRHFEIVVYDNGLPFPQVGDRAGGGLGLDLVERLLDPIGGQITLPANGRKCFEIRVPNPTPGRKVTPVMATRSDSAPVGGNLLARDEISSVPARSLDHAEPVQESNRDALCPHLAAACIYARTGDKDAHQRPPPKSLAGTTGTSMQEKSCEPCTDHR